MPRPDPMQRRWSVKPENPESAALLRDRLGVCSLTAKALVARGVATVDDARTFLSASLNDLPDPNGIAGMEAAVARVTRAVTAGEPIWIYTDFDADGVTSAAVLGHFFSRLGIDCKRWLPRRDREGYGLHVEPLEEIAARGGGLVITADCGITSHEAARAAKRLGLGLVITDHHTPAETLPEADAVANPKIEGTSYPDPMIAGVGVAWNLVAGVRRALRDQGWFAGSGEAEGGEGGGSCPEPDVVELLDLVALGTVADVVPLRDVNRTLVRWGVRRINESPRTGIGALARAARLTGEIRAGHLAFQLGPRINAAGRMEGPDEAVRLLLTEDPQEATELAAKLDRLNRDRRAEEKRVVDDALAKVEQAGWHPDRWSFAVEGDGYHPGVIGIVASRLVERYHRPTVVLALEGKTAKGSARSIPGLDLHDALGDCAGLLVKFGGHKAAAGLTIAREKIEPFRDAFEAAVRKRLTPEELVPLVAADADATLDESGLREVEQLSRLEPFGVGNPTPLFRYRDLEVREVRPLGDGGDHVRLRLAEPRDGVTREVEGVGWSKGQEWRELRAGARVDVIAAPKARVWNGRAYVQLELKALKSS